ncbi:DUF2268 domain-containing protein [Nonomuraea sp. NPDC050790]|uniref:DUF2268 domain-containing protein n=1 Tax=Nonomuraea sp. NPDC050790 TaxID=3364371 RepID=UPI00379ED925
MKFLVHDNLDAMAAILRAPLPERPDLLREMLEPIRAIIPFPGDIVDIHQQGGGFRVDAEDPRYLPAVERLVSIDLKGRIEKELERASAGLSHLKQPDLVRVMFVLGNPDNDHLMTTARGYYGMGGTPGWLYLLAWPTDENVERIAHCAVHELHHQIRYHNVEWNPATVTVGEHIVAEGLAEAFVRELSGPQAMGPWSAMVSGEPLEDAYRKIMADIDLQGMQNTPAYVLGDTATAKFGGEPRGIPDMAGYAVGLRLVEAHLAATGMSAAESSGLPAAEILRASR